jgi:hypothetical protein
MAKRERYKGEHRESEHFARRINDDLGARPKGRDGLANGNVFYLQERGAVYSDDSCLENEDIGLENEYFWNVFPARSDG